MSVSEPTIAPQEPSPGASLRRARENAGMSLADLARRTLIPLNRLQALEEDNYARVGVATFITGYTRTYARTLGLDPAPLVQLQESRLAALGTPVVTTPSIAMSLEVRKRPGSAFGPLMWVFVVAAVLVLVMGVIGLGVLDSKPSAPEAPPALLPSSAPAVNRVILPQPTLPGAETPAPAEIAPEVIEEVLDDQDFGLSEAAQTNEDSALSPAAAVAESGSPARLTLSFSDDCWVEVTDAAGKRIVARSAASGDNLQLFGQPPFDVTLGNAPAVQMALNGRPVDTTPPGSRRTLRLKVAE